MTAQTDAKDLLHCPFCGSASLSLREVEGWQNVPECQDCGAIGPRAELNTAALWNIRCTEQAGRIAELEAKLGEARDHVQALAVAEDIEDIGPVITAAQSWLAASGATIKLPEPTPDQIEYLRSVTDQTAYDPATVIGTAVSATGGKE